ncbi:ABC transporter permease [Candidatus Lokiarchaeum ossiferum]|uniref:ABC transporter permease n=1 Tax=Candidatus Lokiarchaeum ossiferum TaxID=2951803 RepID=UPI00352D70E7
MSLLKYTIRRILALIPILFGVLFMSFVLTRAMPDNPYKALIGDGGFKSDAQRQEYLNNVERLGLDKPVISQFLIYVGALFRGDWGTSISMQNGADVWDLLMAAFPKSIEITIYSMIFATIIGIRAGIISAVNRNRPKDTAIRFVALAGVAIPVFWMGLMLQYILVIKGQILPFATNYNSTKYEISYVDDKITGLRLLDSLINLDFGMFWDTFLHLILPVFCLSFITIAGITRQTRSSMLEVLELDYIRTARAKGCTEKQVIYKHAWRNAMIPTITIVGLNVAGLMGGAVLTEHTFNLSGMGVTTLLAIRAVDYYVINAAVFLMTFIFVVVNLITDLIYGLVDPRIRY